MKRYAKRILFSAFGTVRTPLSTTGSTHELTNSLTHKLSRHSRHGLTTNSLNELTHSTNSRRLRSLTHRLSASLATLAHSWSGQERRKKKKKLRRATRAECKQSERMSFNAKKKKNNSTKPVSHQRPATKSPSEARVFDVRTNAAGRVSFLSSRIQINSCCHHVR